MLREEVGLSQNKLIEEIAKPPYNLKISRRTLQYWESGERDIKTDKAQILAEYFGVSVAELLGYVKEKPIVPNKKSNNLNALKFSRIDGNVSIETLTEFLGVTVDQYFKWENNEEVMPFDKAWKISRFYDRDIHLFTNFEEIESGYRTIEKQLLTNNVQFDEISKKIMLLDEEDLNIVTIIMDRLLKKNKTTPED